MKPNWNDAPHWANYMAMDENGNWYWYENEPIGFNSDNEWVCGDGRAEVVTPNHNSDWKKTLESKDQ